MEQGQFFSGRFDDYDAVSSQIRGKWMRSHIATNISIDSHFLTYVAEINREHSGVGQENTGSYGLVRYVLVQKPIRDHHDGRVIVDDSHEAGAIITAVARARRHLAFAKGIPCR